MSQNPCSPGSWQPLGAAARSAVVSALDAFETPPKKALLDNETLRGTGGSKSQSWRYKALPIVRRLLTPSDGSKAPCVCRCMRYPAMNGNSPLPTKVAEVYRTPQRRLKLVGLQKCGSSWLCPVCTVSHARRQWLKTEKALKACRRLGGIAVMLTNTVGRDPDEPLADVKAALLAALVAARQTRAWKAAKKSGLLLGAMPFIEVLHGKLSGWHPHSHTLAIFKGSRSQVEAVIDAFQAAYMASLRRNNRPVDAEAQHVLFIETDEDLARYITKSNAAWEVSGGVKAARSRMSRSFWDLLYLAEAGDTDAAQLARQYAAEMPGTRSGVMSPELAKNLGFDLDDGDAFDDVEPESDLLGKVHVDVMVRLANNGHLSDLSDAVEACEGWSTLEDRIYLWARCTEYERYCFMEMLEFHERR